MARYTFICEHLEYDMFRGEENGVASKHTTEFNADDLTTMLENFESFLRGAGFHFEGVLDVVKPEDEDEWDTGENDLGNHVVSSMVDDLIKNPIKMDMPGTLGSAKIVFSDDLKSKPAYSVNTEQLSQLNVGDLQNFHSFDFSFNSER